MESEQLESETSYIEHEETRESIMLEHDEDGNIQSIDDLQNQGIGAADIQKLKAAGICTVKVKKYFTLKGVQMTTKRQLARVKGLSEAKVDKIKEAAAKLSVT